MPTTQPIIVIKKKAAHGGHHGGAWKVAYADFVTAMMALFIVLWLMNTSKQVQDAVGGYFRDPKGTTQMAGTNHQGAADNFTLNKQDMSKIKNEIENSLKQMTDFDKLKDLIQMTVTPEGLRIELLETEKGTFFDTGKPEPTSKGKELLTLLAAEIGKLPNRISIEGHSDSRPYSGNGEYSNWELSADRANAARRLMQKLGLSPNQISQVRGFADQRLRKPDHPDDPSNRRISLIVQYMTPEEEQSASALATSAGESPKTSSGEKASGLVTPVQ